MLVRSIALYAVRVPTRRRSKSVVVVVRLHPSAMWPRAVAVAAAEKAPRRRRPTCIMGYETRDYKPRVHNINNQILTKRENAKYIQSISV